jgi:excisionase family DNA binding protein
MQAMAAEARKPRSAETGTIITEDEACELLKISARTIQNYVSSGKITPDMYTTGVNKTRFYFREKLMGL